MQTSMRVDQANRDRLARIAETELGGATLDDALGVLLFEHESRRALARLAADPEMADDYLRESSELADVDTEVTE
ncbi:hypothetical protein [Amycolatopsis pithecellobii]|uniref:Uncharacterized protein n=1 Tax=Amycolatopsis pithecellobii TaxID=664692 RepID=A0A6N7YXG8_9PSEU|nr:hypothetical protein [Amycolatopsis pithecellobii]MTD57765.1 hypothetical protein [Amycolatopsis pithecellobii]